MKKRRTHAPPAPRSPRAEPAALVIPKVPGIDVLEETAASDTPSLPGAWWVSLQAAEHLIRSSGPRDPRTGESLACSLRLALDQLVEEAAGARRPFPCDQLFSAAELVREPLRDLTKKHRTKIVRTHQMLPLHRARELDGKSHAWLSRRPGRTMREKLASSRAVLAVMRRLSADTPENRMVAAVCRRFSQAATARLMHAPAYDLRQRDRARRDLVEQARDLSISMERFVLMGVTPATRVQRNNVVVGDARYSRMFGAWRELDNLQAAAPGNWDHALERVTTVINWLVLAELIRDGQAFLPDVPCVTHDTEGTIGIRSISSAETGLRWCDDPLSTVLVAPKGASGAFRVVQVRRDGKSRIKVCVEDLGGRDGRLRDPLP